MMKFYYDFDNSKKWYMRHLLEWMQIEAVEPTRYF